MTDKQKDEAAGSPKDDDYAGDAQSADTGEPEPPPPPPPGGYPEPPAKPGQG